MVHVRLHHPIGTLPRIFRASLRFKYVTLMDSGFCIGDWYFNGLMTLSIRSIKRRFPFGKRYDDFTVFPVMAILSIMFWMVRNLPCQRMSIFFLFQDFRGEREFFAVNVNQNMFLVDSSKAAIMMTPSLPSSCTVARAMMGEFKIF